MRDQSNKPIRVKNRVSRRQYLLGGLTGITVGLSGCLGWLPGSDSSDSDSSVISETGFEETNLTVMLVEDSKATSVELIDSEGSPIAMQEISTGQTKASFPLIDDDQPLPPGTYQIVVGQDGETIDKQSIELAASWELTEVRSHEPPMAGGVPTDLAVTVENTGTLPVKLTNLSVKGVPNPTDEAPTRINAEAAAIEEQQLIGIDQSAAFHTETRPFEHDQSAESPCGSTKQATLNLTIEPTGTQQFTASVSYNGGVESSSQLTKFCKNISIENVSKQS